MQQEGLLLKPVLHELTWDRQASDPHPHFEVSHRPLGRRLALIIVDHEALQL